MKTIQFIAFLLLSHAAFAQIIINEINYNPPESNQDSLEYIELWNTTNVNISLSNWVINDAVNIVFPDTFIKANSALVICVNATAFENVYGFAAIQWDAGALRNDSEIITLLDNNGNVIDSVRYSDTSPAWPTGPDGNGSSLELCRTNVDNYHSEYWKSSNTLIGKKINNFDVKGTPGVANFVPCADVTVDVKNFAFTPNNIEIFIGQHIEWKNSGGSHNVNGSTSTFPNNPEGFINGTPSSGSWTFIKRFDKEGNYDFRCDAHPSQMTGKIKVRKVDANYPSYPIGLVTSVNAEGVVDSNNVRCTLEGIVHGINFRGGGLQFTIIDVFNDGIVVFNSTNPFNYTVKEGDRIRIKGSITQFNGLTEILPDTLNLINANNPLFAALPVTALNENTESQLIKIKNVSLVNSAQWTKNPLGFTVKVTDGTNTYDVRIDNDCELVNKEAPAGKFDLTGLGYQNDGLTPFLDGYQIYPRTTADINPYFPQGKYYPPLDIGKVRSTKPNGEIDSLNVKCELKGLVYGIDYDGGPGLLFTLIDNTGGITVFSSQKSYNYKVLEGDEIIVRGIVDQFMGQAEIVPDTIIFLSEKNKIRNPREVFLLSETTESDLIKLTNLNLVDPNEWLGNGSSFNVRLTNGTREFIMRIDNDSELSKMSINGMKGPLTVIGLGNQFDSELPYTEGYQIWPRYKSDVDFVSQSDQLNMNKIQIFPNPAQDKFIFNSDKSDYQKVEILSLDGKIIKSIPFKQELDCDFGSGIFIVRLQHKNGFDIARLIIE